MRESDPLTQYLNVVYDVHEVSTVILDTTPLPTRPAPHPNLKLRRPQTARPVRTTPAASHPNNAPSIASNPLPRSKPKAARPQTARADIGRRPPAATSAIKDLSKAEKAEQKHIRRRLDAFLVGNKARGHRVFVGVAPERDQQCLHHSSNNNDCHGPHDPLHPTLHEKRQSGKHRHRQSVVATTPPPTGGAHDFVTHARHVRPASQEEAFIYNFNPEERMIAFRVQATPPPTAPANAAMTPVAKLGRRLERHASARRRSMDRMRSKGSPPSQHHHSLFFGRGGGKQHTHSQAKITPCTPHNTQSKHQLNASDSTDSTATLHSVQQKAAIVKMMVSASQSNAAIKPHIEDSELEEDGTVMTVGSRGTLKRQPSAAASHAQQGNSVIEVVQARTNARQLKNRRKQKSGAQYVEEYRNAVARQRAQHAATARVFHAPTTPTRPRGDVKSSVDTLELWRSHVLATGLPSSFGAVVDGAPPTVMRPRPKSAGVKPSVF